MEADQRLEAMTLAAKDPFSGQSRLTIRDPMGFCGRRTEVGTRD